jgi:hypothetical protein
MIRLLILTDIFGDTIHTHRIKAFFSMFDVQSCSAYSEQKDFNDEDEAYATFMQECGHENYFLKCKSVVEQFKPDVILGFSIGGTVAWRLSQEVTNVSLVLCYYPSAIRHFLSISPKVDTQVIFASFEKSFDVNVLSHKINARKNVISFVHFASHGFMNVLSKNHDKKAYNETMENIYLKIVNMYSPHKQNTT